MAAEGLAGLESLSEDFAKGDPACLPSLARALAELRTLALTEEGADELTGCMAVPRLVNVLTLLSAHCPELYGLGKGDDGRAVAASSGFTADVSSAFATPEASGSAPSPELQSAAIRPLVAALRVLQVLLAKSSGSRIAFLQEGGLDAVATLADRLCTAALLKQKKELVPGLAAAAPSPSTAPGSAGAQRENGVAAEGLPVKPSVPSLHSPAAAGGHIQARRNKSLNRLVAANLNLKVAPGGNRLSSFLAQSGSGGGVPSPVVFSALSGFQNVPPPSPSATSLPLQVSLPADHELALAKALQLLGNFCAGGETYQRATLDRCFPGTLARAATTQSWPVLSPLCMILYTSCRASPAMAKVLACTADGASLLASLLRAEGPKVFGPKDVFPSPVGPGDAGAGMDEWLSLLVQLLCVQMDHLLPIFKNVRTHSPRRPPHGPSSPGLFCPEQAALLWLLWGALHDRATRAGALPQGMPGEAPEESADEAGAGAGAGGSNPEGGDTEGRPEAGSGSSNASSSSSVASEKTSALRIATGPALEFLLSTCKGAATAVAKAQAGAEPAAGARAGAGAEPEAGAGLGIGEETAPKVLRFSLQILRLLAAEQGEQGSAAGAPEVSPSGFWSSSAIPVLLDMLRALGPPERAAPRTKGAPDGPSESAGEAEIDTEYPRKNPYEGYRRDLVAVVGNACFRVRACQDAVRGNAGLLLLLQQCVVDEPNPFLREWGLWAVRNALESNEPNQKEVAALEVVGAAPNPELREMGLRVTVDPATKQAKLENVGAGEA